ncbi:hypothetical protein BGW36DRAFT_358733 [Talaromyces proteolyticus]|uniref:Uncharacterized protein n=1 Tax=Talaromyces proteolyticus TaxID=1131652 RepID=A0AAD4KSA3_9EURO|nr:uncharacterized protein BGW36DRAFT_358733 [Talaromyces proteolyticus]KAH8699230.1 hypothetical protein BGW36DRAFT_358733 [Talaromyces proteolyticus]
MKPPTYLGALVVAMIMFMVQFCPAPPAILEGVLLGAAGAFPAGVLITLKTLQRRNHIEIEMRDEDAFASFPQPAGSLCKSELNQSQVVFTSPSSGTLRIDGVPPACMTLSDTLIGQNSEDHAPTPMGSASLQYQNLSQEMEDRLHSVLQHFND